MAAMETQLHQLYTQLNALRNEVGTLKNDVSTLEYEAGMLKDEFRDAQSRENTLKTTLKATARSYDSRIQYLEEKVRERAKNSTAKSSVGLRDYVEK